MAKSKLDALTRSQQKVLRWWLDGRHEEDDEGNSGTGLLASRTHLMESDDDKTDIAIWSTPWHCIVRQPEHPVGAALIEEMDRWSIEYHIETAEEATAVR